MIPKINHFALTAHTLIHDEEAVTTLELLGRVAAKMNTVVEQINENTDHINTELEKLPDYAGDAVTENIENGVIRELINADLMNALKLDLETLENRLDNLLISGSSTENNSELIDARNGKARKFATLGYHMRSLGDGSAFADAVRPGTVEPGRIMPGMLGGELTEHTTPAVIGMGGYWTGGNAYYDKDTLERVEHASYTVSTFFPCSYGDMYELESYLFGNKVYPAVIFDEFKNPLSVLGKPGKGDWTGEKQTITVPDKNAAYIAFICGNQEIANFRARQIMVAQDFGKTSQEKGYVHMRAMKRTNTVTDRAQIRFSLPREAAEGNFITIHPGKMGNVAGWTFRTFNAATPETYDQAGVSSSGYTFDPDNALRIYFETIPETTTEGEPVTHVSIFIDLLPVDGSQMMDVSLVLPNGALFPALHGGANRDNLNVVSPGAAGSPLYGKKVLGFGDSLMKGNTLPKPKSWFNIACGSVDMNMRNLGENGQPIHPTIHDLVAAHVEYEQPDYVVVQGGANDLRLGVHPATFRESLRSIVDTVREKVPACKILFMTNWRRSDYKTSEGFGEVEYVEEMLLVAEEKRVPCMNNFAESIDLTDPNTAAWADEGLVTNGEANIHFSERANEYLAAAFIKKLEGI